MNASKFLEIEKKYDLYNKEICGVNYWMFHRFNIWNNDICVKNLQLSTSYQQKKLSISSIIKKLWNGLHINHIPHNVNVLFLTSGFRIKNGAFYDCKYTEKLNDLSPNCATLEEPFNSTHFHPTRTPHLIYSDYIINSVLIHYKLLSPFYKKKQTEIINELENQLNDILDEINRSYNCTLKKNNLYASMAKTILRHDLFYKKYDKLIARLNPKIIIEVCYYNFSKMIMNEVAKDRNIPVIELQHGTIYEEHLAYQYATKNQIKQLPDKIFLFSDFWKRRIHLPLSTENLISVGFPTFDEQIQHYNATKSENKYTILFISQGTVGVYLSFLAEELSKLLSPDKYRIIFKLHPSECTSWKEHYPHLADEKIEVIDNSQESIYKFFGESNMQIGVYSTAIYEGLGFGLKTLILRVGHYEAMDLLVQEKFAEYIDSAQDVINILNQGHTKTNNSESIFWKRNAIQNIKKEIDPYLK